MTQNQSGKTSRLSLVGTPIGNLKDITLRAIEVFKEADILLCEDTRRTNILLKALKIEREGEILSFHDHTSRKFLETVETFWEEGKHVAYVTDAGMPSVADPGYVLVDLAHKKDVFVSVVPGASAVTAFFAGAGLPSPKFLFHGFFPRSKGEVEKVLSMVSDLSVVHIFFEAPSRIKATLDVFKRNAPERLVVIGRELTKMYEEFLEGTPEELLTILEEGEKARGEFVFGVMGGDVLSYDAQEKKKKSNKVVEAYDPFEIPKKDTESLSLTGSQHELLVAAMKSGLGSKEVAKQFSKQFGISRRSLYDYIVKHLT